MVLTLYLCLSVAACQLYSYGTAYKIQVLMIEKDIEALSDLTTCLIRGRGTTLSSSLSVFVGYFCVPTVAGWIIEAGGGIGSYGRNVNQTAQHGGARRIYWWQGCYGWRRRCCGKCRWTYQGALLKGK